MELQKLKPLLILGVIIIALLLIVMIINISNKSEGDNRNSQNAKEDTNYPEVSDTEEDILAKIYNEDSDYFTGFDNKSGEKENIFGNKKEVVAKNFDEKTRLSLAIYSYSIEDMEKMSCSAISWDSSWKDTCGSNNSNIAYIVPVGDLNVRVREMFNIKPDYSTLNIDDLTIGSCTGSNNNSYVFRYVKDRSIFVSTKRTSSCTNNGVIDITNIEKTQAGSLLTLTVSYDKKEVNSINGKNYYDMPESHKDKFFFKVKKDGSYYFNSSTLIK